jgi:hypothetical protein
MRGAYTLPLTCVDNPDEDCATCTVFVYERGIEERKTEKLWEHKGTALRPECYLLRGALRRLWCSASTCDRKDHRAGLDLGHLPPVSYQGDVRVIDNTGLMKQRTSARPLWSKARREVRSIAFNILDPQPTKSHR